MLWRENHSQRNNGYALLCRVWDSHKFLLLGLNLFNSEEKAAMTELLCGDGLGLGYPEGHKKVSDYRLLGPYVGIQEKCKVCGIEIKRNIFGFCKCKCQDSPWEWEKSKAEHSMS